MSVCFLFILYLSPPSWENLKSADRPSMENSLLSTVSHETVFLPAHALMIKQSHCPYFFEEGCAAGQAG